MTMLQPSTELNHRSELIALADSLGDGLVWIDEDGHIADASERFAELTGFTRDQLIGGFPPHPEGVPEERAELVEAAAATVAGHPRLLELTLTRRDGTTVPVVVAGSVERSGFDTFARLAVRDGSDQLRARAALESAERRLNGLIEATDQLVWFGDPEGKTECVNAPMAQLLGEEADALVGRPLESFVPAGLSGQARSAFTAARQDGASRRLRTVLALADGTDVPVGLRLHPIAGADGRTSSVVATIAEASSLAAPHRTRVHVDPLDMIDAAVMALDAEGRIRHWNEGARRLTGYAAAETLGRHAATMLWPGDAGQEIASARLRALHRTGSWQGEATLVRRDGTPVPVYMRSVRVDEDANSFASIDIAVDMTEWNDQQSRLAEARSYLGAVANSMADGLYAVTTDGRLAFMNPAAERMLGWTTAELKGRVMHSVVHYQRPDGSAFPIHECPAYNANASGETIKVDEDAFTRRDGTLLPVAYTASPIRNGAATVGSVVVFQDIGERKAEKERMQAELEKLTWIERVQTALEDDGLVLCADPVADLKTGAIDQLRLHAQVVVDGRHVPDSEFIPHIGSHDLVTEIDRWAIERACELARDGVTVKYDPAPRSVGDPSFRTDVGRLIAESAADPAKLVFGITEDVLLADRDGATGFVGTVHALGCRIGLDNFGTGFGGPTLLNTLQVHFLKLGGELVRDVAEQTASQYVVGTVVDLARRFGLKTVASDADSPEALATLRELGVDYARGTAVGAAAPVRDLVGAS